MKKIIILLLLTLSFCGFAEEKKQSYLGKVLTITATKSPTTQYHIIYTTQQGVVGVIENVNLKEQVHINTSTYCIHGFLIEEEQGNLMNTKHYIIQDNPPGDKNWVYKTHQNEVTSLQYEISKLREELKKSKSSE